MVKNIDSLKPQDLTYSILGDEKGTYVIVLYLDENKSIQIGKLGQFKFKKGYYAYVGSAFGPGGLKSRIKRHIEPKKSYHWHIDYLNPAVKEVWVSGHGESLEHEWAAILGKIASAKILGFGCSDCSCESHLFYFKFFGFLQNFQKELCKKRPVIKEHVCQVLTITPSKLSLIK